jgi:hypothetical protein
MAKINIRAGDIPETDQEVEKILEKMERKPKVVRKKVVERQLEDHELQDWVEQGATAKEQAERAEHANAGYPVMVKEEAQGVEVDIQVDHGTERIVKEKPAVKKQPAKKSPKPKVERVSKRNPNWKTPVHQTPENFRGMVADAKAGMTIDEIATKYGCIVGLVRFVLQGKGRTQHTNLTPPGIWPEYLKMRGAKSKKPVAKSEKGKVGK